MFDIEELALPGLLLIRPPRHLDQRGHFTKIFHEPTFKALGLVTTFDEYFYSVSGRNVLRGLHVQTPPFDGEKCVTCIAGSADDVVVDLRTESPTYGRHQIIPLSAGEPAIVYVPRGFAHGFLSLEDQTTLLYAGATRFEASADGGILWNSADIPWRVEDPIISQRDLGLPALADFESPFSSFLPYEKA